MAKSRKAAGAKAEAAAGSDGETVGLSFEGALEQLEATVGRLEEGEMPLEEALVLFERGVTLSRQCTETLDAAEKRIEILVAERDDAWASEPFEASDHDDDHEADEAEEEGLDD